MADFLKRLVPKRFQKKGVVIPVVRLHGPIMSGGSRFRPALNLASIAGQLEKAFGMKDSPAVALSINSPGGSPVQSRMIYDRIRPWPKRRTSASSSSSRMSRHPAVT